MFDANSNPTVALTEIQRLTTLVSEVKAALQSQQEILRMRGMSLPPGALQNLDNLDRDLKTLENQLGSDETELGQLRALAATSAMINSSLDLDEVLARAMEEVTRLSGAERGYIVLRDVNSGALDFRVARDLDSGDNRAAGTFQGSNTILNEVLTTGQPLLTDNAYKDPRMQDNRSVAQLVLRSVLCVPLSYKDQIIGAVYVDNRLRSGVFTEREKNVLVAFANQAAVAIENARLFTQVQKNLAEIRRIKEVTDNVFASIGSGVITTDAKDKVILYNQAAGDILGRPADKAIGHAVASVLPKMNLELDDYLKEVRETNDDQVLDAEVETNRGRIALNMKLAPLKDDNQKTQGVAMVLDDVTEQRARDEKLNIMSRYLPKKLVANIDQIEQIALGGERREMTCIFIDVRLLSTFPPDFRPRQVMDMLNEYLAVAADAINQANGVVDKYMGTEVMGLFNSQLNPQDDHALQAVEAALIMRDLFIEFYQARGIDPKPHYYRVGIHSGVATMGNVGSLSRRDFTALGDAINTAHRLLENATPGQIVVSLDCQEYMGKVLGKLPVGVRFEALKPIMAKGKTKATEVYEVFRS
jgi:PAS domain S-box-containing protein